MDLSSVIHPRFCSHWMEHATGCLILALRCANRYLKHRWNEGRGSAVYARPDAGSR